MENQQAIRVVLIDDHSLVRDGIKSLLEDQEDIIVVAEAANGKEALQVIGEERPDVAIMDIRMPIMSGIEAVRELTQLQSATRSIILSMHDSPEYVLDAVQAGAHGFVLKDIGHEEFIKAIKTVHQGEKYFSADISKIVVNRYLEITNTTASSTPNTNPAVSTDITLTKRERQIMDLALSGMSNKEIAEHLSKSVRTIETHRFNLMKKMGAKNIAELSVRAKDLGLI